MLLIAFDLRQVRVLMKITNETIDAAKTSYAENTVTRYSEPVLLAHV